jgi:hypothetical protein
MMTARFTSVLFVFAYGAVLLAGEATTKAVNIVPNAGFEQGDGKQATDWSANGYDGAEGAWGRAMGVEGARGKYCFSLNRTNEQGGVQLFSPLIPLQNAEGQRLTLALRYRGSASFQTRFYRQEEGKYVAIMTPANHHFIKHFRLEQTDKWRDTSELIAIPASIRGASLAVRLYFLLQNGREEFNLDEVTLTEELCAEPRKPNPNWLKVVPPADLSPEEAAGYGAFPALGYAFGLQDGYLTRDAKPFFYIGSNTVGGGQAHIASSWLARVMRHSFCEVNRGVGGAMKVSSEADTLTIEYQDAAASYSVLRELARYHLITQLDIGNAYYKYIPLKRYVEKFPWLNEFYTEGSHYYGFDHNTELGRELHFNAWKSYFRHIRDAPLLAFECFNELGYTPRHQRVREGFRQFAREKYDSLAEANRIWGSNFKSWKEVLPPHLTADNDLFSSYSERLNSVKACHETPGYLDWLIYLRADLMPGLRKMKEDFRKLSSAPFAVDWRGHQTDFDGYAAVGLEQLEELADIYFLHLGFRLFDYNRQPADEVSVLTSLTRSLLSHGYVRCNTDKPIFNPEAIHTEVSAPKSDFKAMEQNSLGQFHGKWRFRLDPAAEGIKQEWFRPDLDDSSWGGMEVPGCWDTTEEYKNKQGWGWYRAKFTVPAGLQNDFVDGSKRYLIVGKGVAQNGTIWVNGQKVGEPAGWSTEYQYDISPLLKYGGENSIAFLVDGSGYNNGLRFHFFILPNDRVSTARELEKKEYATILWTSLIHGCSGISLWFWDDPERLFMPELGAELNSVSDIIMPETRHTGTRTAILLPSLSFFGIPHNTGNHLDYLSYFGALTFLQARPDVLDEKKIVGISPASHPLAVIPYAKTVRPEVFAWLRQYVEEGGSAVVTFDSLQQEYHRYSALPIGEFAGVEVAGALNEPVTLQLDGETYPLVKGDSCAKYGMSIKLREARQIASYGDGTPAITVREHGQGRIFYVAARLNLPAASAFFRQTMQQLHITTPVTVTSDTTKEFPYIEAGITGTPQRFVLHLANWGGLTHEAMVSINDPAFREGDYLMRRVRGAPDQGARVTAEEMKTGLRMQVESMDPAIFLFEKTDSAPRVLPKISPRRQALLDRLAELRKPLGESDQNRPKILFLEDISGVTIGRKYHPVVDEFMRQSGCDTQVLPWQKFTPENLRQYAAVFLAEDVSSPYRRIMGSKEIAVLPNLLDYVNQGGSLIIVNASTGHFNAARELLKWFGGKLGFSATGEYCRNPRAHGYGDPLQLRVATFAEHPLAKNVNSLQFFISPALQIKPSCPLQPVVLTEKDDLAYPSAPLVLAGQVGKGRMVVAADLMWLQPFRVEDDDNAQFLMNVIAWALGREPLPYDKQELVKRLPITHVEMERVETEEGWIK